jgi:hypothetical protein
MRRSELEHLIRAAADLVDDEIVVVGSQAILGQHPDAPDSLLVSMEADVYPRRDPSRADRIDRTIGDGSRFHETYDYHARGVGPETLRAPEGWETRLIRIDVRATRRRGRDATGWCLEAHDLVLAKLAAGGERDFRYAEEAIRHHLVEKRELLARVEHMPSANRGPARESLTGLLARIDRGNKANVS